MHKTLLPWTYDPVQYLLARKLVLETFHVIFSYSIHAEINDRYILCREISLHMLKVLD